MQTQHGLATLGGDLRSGLGAIGTAVMAEATGIRADVREVKRDLASVRESVEVCRAENMETDRAALMELFNTTKGPSWKTSTAWGSSSFLGEWYGVTVNAEGRVTKLHLNDNNLTEYINMVMSLDWGVVSDVILVVSKLRET
ncbi:unnamed protein product [Ectocarpus sp. CCAP 1310/34]|nr:unnamed protein product [Ectocarpus sp. CCAP 1310/34]